MNNFPPFDLYLFVFLLILFFTTFKTDRSSIPIVCNFQQI